MWHTQCYVRVEMTTWKMQLGVALVLATTSSGYASVKRPEIGNGVETTGFAPVVELMFGTSEKMSLCTGTQIRPGTILTAAHCVCNGPLISLNGQRVPFSEAKSMQYDCDAEVSFKENRSDVALVHIPISQENMPIRSALFELGHFPAGQRVPEIGERVYIVGFGMETTLYLFDSGAGTKRWGENIIDQVSDGLIFISGTTIGAETSLLTNIFGWVREGNGNDVTGLPGDSGGPLLSEDYEVLGVMSVVSRREHDSQARNWIVPTGRRDVRRFIRNTFPQ